MSMGPLRNNYHLKLISRVEIPLLTLAMIMAHSEKVGLVAVLSIHLRSIKISLFYSISPVLTTLLRQITITKWENKRILEIESPELWDPTI